MIFWRLNQHIQNHNILVSEQYGFRKGLLTDNATYEQILFLKHRLNERYVAGIYCDLAKAFWWCKSWAFATEIEILWCKGVILDWVKSYSFNRKHRVESKSLNVQNCFSDWESIKHGVPQRWVLGHLLFNI